MDISFYIALGSAALSLFHVVAAKTKNKTDDKIADRLEALEKMLLGK